MTDQILIDTQNRVTTVTINRPEKRGAINQAMYAAMADALIQYGHDDDVRAFVITGTGEYFTSGNDLADFSTGGGDGDELPPVARFLDAIQTCAKPVIGAVNGPAIGVGLTMLLHCDLVYAAEPATFAAPFVGLGLVPEAASSMLLPAAVGMAVANDVFLTGRALTSEEALRFGLVARIFTAAEFTTKVQELAHAVANSAPTAMKRSKALIRYNREQVTAHMHTESHLFREQLLSPDFAESVAAKMQKRPAVFK